VELEQRERTQIRQPKSCSQFTAYFTHSACY
jgi:hypothetical protein